jgi:hypothetical protein
MKLKKILEIKQFAIAFKIVMTFFIVLLTGSSVYAQFWGNNGFLVRSESLITGNMDLAPHSDSFKEGNTLYFTDYYGFNIYDISDMANPFPIGRIGTPGFSCNFVIQGDYVFIADWTGLSVVSITDHANPQVVFFTELFKAQDVEVNGDYLFVAVGEGVRSYNISNPEEPIELDYLHITPGSIDFSGLAITDYALYFGNMLTLFSINYTYPANLVIENQTNFNTGGSFWGNFAKKDNYLYAASSLGICIYDISDPFNPDKQYQGTPIGSSNYDVNIEGDIMCVSHNSSKWGLFNITNPIDPVELYISENSPFNHRFAIGQLKDNYAFFMDHWEDNGNGYTIHIFDILNPEEPQEVGDIKSVNGESLATCLFVKDDIEYALVGQDNLTDNHAGYMRVMDVSDPGNPVLVSTLEIPGSVYSIATDGSDYAFVKAATWGIVPYKLHRLYQINISDLGNSYIVSDYALNISTGYMASKDMSVFNDRLYVVDIKNLYIFKYNGNVLELSGSTDVYGENGRGIKITNSDYGYIAGGDYGFQIYNISNPAQPLFLTYFNTDGNAFGMDVAGGYAYVADYENGLVILDISQNIATFVSQINTASPAMLVTVYDMIAYVILENGDFEFINISDPENPQSFGTYNSSGETKNIAVSSSNGYLHIADYLDFAIIENLTVGLPEIPGNTEMNTFNTYPNPVVSTIYFTLDMGNEKNVNIRLYDIFGRKVKTLLNRQIEQGNHTLEFDASDLSQGVYFIRINNGSNHITKKIIVAR